MNLESIKKNGGVVAFLVALLIVLGFAGLKLRGALGKQAEINLELEEQERRLTELRGFRPYPSNDNVQRLRENRVELERLFGELKTAAYRPVEVPQVDQVQFARLLGEKLTELSKKANAANVRLPDQFVFGFEKYIGRLPPDNRQVIHSLTKQFLVIAKLSHLLFQSGVYSISSITREDIDAPGATVAAAEASGAIYHRTPFQLVFTGDTQSLRNFLNGLADAEWLLVVRAMNLEVKQVAFTVPAQPETSPTTSGPDGRFYEDIPMMAPTPYAGGRFRETIPMVTPAPGAPIMTTVMREQVQVSMEIDLIEFPQEPQPTNANPPS